MTRSTLDYPPVPESADDLRLMRLLDEIYRIDPCLGTRRLGTLLERDHGEKVHRKRLQRLRRKMGLEAIWWRPRTSLAQESHRKYPCLLRGLVVSRPEQVWCADVCQRPPALPFGQRLRPLAVSLRSAPMCRCPAGMPVSAR